MDTESILLTSKLDFRLLFWALILSLGGCGQSPPQTLPNTSESTPLKMPDLAQSKEANKPPKLNYGPKQVQSPTYIDEAKKYGLDSVESIQNYQIDLDGDYRSDLVVLPDFSSVPRFFLFNSKKKRFQETTGRIEGNPRASFLHFNDYNGDGILDLIVAVYNYKTVLTQRPLRFYRGEKSSKGLFFRFVKGAFRGPPLKPTSMTALDFNRDGRLDLLVTHRASRGKYPQTLQLLQNEKNGNSVSFKDVSGSLSLSRMLAQAPASSATLCQMGPRREMSIGVLNDSGYENLLWGFSVNSKNNPIFSRRYREVFGMDQQGSRLNRGGGNSQFALCHDFNGDGIQDLFIGEKVSPFDGPQIDRSSIIVAEGEKYFRNPIDLGPGHEVSNLHNVLVLGSNSRNKTKVLLENTAFPPHTRLEVFDVDSRSLIFEPDLNSGLDLINPSGAILIDVNQDGVREILVGQTSKRASELPRRMYLFKERIPANRHYLIYLIGKKSGVNPLGSRITLVTNKGKRSFFIGGDAGRWGRRSEPAIEFRLAPKERARYLEINWASGGKRRYKLKNHEKGAKAYTLCEGATSLRLGRGPC